MLLVGTQKSSCLFPPMLILHGSILGITQRTSFRHRLELGTRPWMFHRECPYGTINVDILYGKVRCFHFSDRRSTDFL